MNQVIVLEEPTRARLIGYENKREELEKFLSYEDERVKFELKKTRDSIKRFTKLQSKLLELWGTTKYEAVMTGLQEKVRALRAQVKKTILQEDEKGLWVPSGVAYRLARAVKDTIERLYPLPEFDEIPWAHLPKFQDRPYQVQAHDLLIEACKEGPCGVELPTGAGKSTVIRNLVKTIALGTTIMAPSTSIAGQLYEDLLFYFGKPYVGMYGDGKKDFNKQIVVAIDDSLAKVEKGSDVWKAFASKPVFIADESHLTPANSLQRVCYGLCANAPYRFFFSATQLRNDGLGIVLDGITGRIVLRKELRELVDEGYLARPSFKLVRVRARTSYNSPDPNQMTRHHLYYNETVNKIAGELANKFVGIMKRPTLILVEELEQFRELLPHLQHKVAFAHGPLDKAKKKLVPEEYHSKDNKALVDAFNRGEIPILVGTSCVSTGTDIQVAEAGIYLQGGKSEIKVKQGAIGRFTRGGFNGHVVNPWTGQQKRDAIIVDFDVVDPDLEDPTEFAPHRHAMERVAIYTDAYAAPDIIDYTHRM
jgi:superfamily II DNA or RNA helicase